MGSYVDHSKSPLHLILPIKKNALHLNLLSSRQSGLEHMFREQSKHFYGTLFHPLFAPTSIIHFNYLLCSFYVSTLDPVVGLFLLFFFFFTVIAKKTHADALWSLTSAWPCRFPNLMPNNKAFIRPPFINSGRLRNNLTQDLGRQPNGPFVCWNSRNFYL